MAPVLGWDKDQIEKEVEHYEKRVEAERESQRQPDDQTADAARLGAPDIVPLLRCQGRAGVPGSSRPGVRGGPLRDGRRGPG